MCSKKDSSDKRGVFLSTRQGQNTGMLLDRFLRLLMQLFILRNVNIPNSLYNNLFFLMCPDIRAGIFDEPSRASFQTVSHFKAAQRYRRPILPTPILVTSPLAKAQLWTASHRLYVFILITQLALFSSKVNCLLCSGNLVQR